MGHVCEVRNCLNCEERLAIYCGKCVDAEREELNRLREALERIGNEYHWDDSPAGRLAREALGKPNKEKRDG